MAPTATLGQRGHLVGALHRRKRVPPSVLVPRALGCFCVRRRAPARYLAAETGAGAGSINRTQHSTVAGLGLGLGLGDAQVRQPARGRRASAAPLPAAATARW